MSSKNQQNENPQNNQQDGQEFDRSEALKNAILKLQAQGKIKGLPPELMGLVEGTDASAEESTVPEDEKPKTPRSSDDVLESESEKARWSAVLSGWDTTPQKLEKEERKRKTSEVQVIVNPEQDEVLAQIAAEAAKESDGWGAWDEPDEPNEDSEPTILEEWNKPEVIEQPESVVVRKQITPKNESEKSVAPSSTDTPWTLQQFFNGEIDLDIELTKRFPSVPIVSAVKFRTLGADAHHRVATLTTTDGAASVIIDANAITKEIQISFTYGSMLTLRYALTDLSDADRSRWLELMRREKGGLAFLWGPTRWQKDYLICISRQYATKIYAFSPNSFESVVRLSQDVMEEVVKWLDEIWSYQPKADTDDDAPLLTW